MICWKKRLSDKFQHLVEIMEKLRSKEGCPWDKVQTHDTLKRYLLEETYELIEAIEKKDFKGIKAELGDLLLQIVFHSKIAKDEDQFIINDVIDTVSTKMINRNPHVFVKPLLKLQKKFFTNGMIEKKKRENLKTLSLREFLLHYQLYQEHIRFSQELQRLVLPGIELKEF